MTKVAHGNVVMLFSEVWKNKIEPNLPARLDTTGGMSCIFA